MSNLSKDNLNILPFLSPPLAAHFPIYPIMGNMFPFTIMLNLYPRSPIDFFSFVSGQVLLIGFPEILGKYRGKMEPAMSHVAWGHFLEVIPSSTTGVDPCLDQTGQNLPLFHNSFYHILVSICSSLKVPLKSHDEV